VEVIVYPQGSQEPLGYFSFKDRAIITLEIFRRLNWRMISVIRILITSLKFSVLQEKASSHPALATILS
jgi:hypothetical protein